MVLTRLISCLLVLAGLVLSGCRCSNCGCVPSGPTAPCVFPESPTATVTPDVAALLPACPGECQFPCLLPAPSEAYDLLDRSTCQCNAATNTTVANAVEIERYWATVLIGCESEVVTESLCLTRSLLSLQAADLRNASAASALTSFYLLAGVEASEDQVELGIREVEASLARIDRLKAKDLPVPDALDRGALAARRDELHDKQLQLCFARIQLNGQLKRLLGCPLDESRLFWPEVDWAPDLEPLDIESLVAEGVAVRSDLRSLRLVQCKLDKATLPVARQVLAVIDGALGTVAPTPGILAHLRCGKCKDHEIPVRCRQLSMLEADATQLATGKIKSAAYKVAIQQDRVRLAKQVVDQRREWLIDLEQRRDTDDISAFEISSARGRVFEAESSLIEKVVELKVAEVGLREVQGMLAAECGYHPVVCNEHCCTGKCGCCPEACGCGQGACCGNNVTDGCICAEACSQE